MAAKLVCPLPTSATSAAPALKSVTSVADESTPSNRCGGVRLYIVGFFWGAIKFAPNTRVLVDMMLGWEGARDGVEMDA
jgi:hypothetical protein